jgi:hypothetical protein
MQKGVIIMAYNSPKFDKDAHYASKTTKQLEELIVFWKETIAHYNESPIGCPKMASEELALVQMKLAERIGKHHA